MGREVVQMRLVQVSPWRVLREWHQSADPQQPDELDQVLISAVKAAAGPDGDWKAALPHRELGWRRAAAMTWNTHRATIKKGTS